MRTFRHLLLTLTLFPTLLSASGPDDWLTDFERSGGERTPRYDETVAFCRRLAAASPWVHYTSLGTSPQHRALPLLIVSTSGAFTPAAAAKTRHAVVLIQAGIHAGEIDGKDAGLQLIRDLVIHKKDAAILDSVIILFVPILNVDGHERFGPYNRINQNGPAEMGWRTTAQNLNLNRDYMKADAPEMRALLRLFAEWLPELYIDCHVTDGIDMQYDVTYATELGPNIDQQVADWTRGTFLGPVLSSVEKSGHHIFWYVFPREEGDLRKGMKGGASPPRFSTGYAALQNRPALLIETHMLKPYRTRVSATYQVLRASLETVCNNASLLRDLVRAADRKLASMHPGVRQTVPLKFDVGPGFTMLPFKAIRHRMEPSTISGGSRTVYTGEPYDVDIPFYDQIVVLDSVSVPAAYVIPPEWSFVPEVLSLHGVRFTRTAYAESLNTETTRFTDVRFRAQPYEGHQTAQYATVPWRTRQNFPAGSVVVPMDQRAAHVAVHLLEPRSDDSFVAWGFFNAVFERKEYVEDYVMETEGQRMLQENPALQSEFLAKVGADSAFARSPERRLNWLYERSPWSDKTLNLYPVGRIDREELLNVRMAPGATR